MSHRAHFRRFHDAAPGRVHFAAHSHHAWPDVTFDAQVEAWNDAVRLADHKWEKIFGEIVPRVSSRIATILGLPTPGSLAFAPNTHELVVRVLSCLPPPSVARPLELLTTDAEFHSFARQAARLEEDGLARVTRIPSRPFASFAARFAAALRARPYDMALFSHVFFDSGYVVDDLGAIASAAAPATFVVVDGYHAFLARPIDLSHIHDRVFYVSGGYKYAMAGEGACFMHVPESYGPRPRNTGWFAAFGALAAKQDGVPYAPGGARFLGATFDPTGLYRLDAVLGWLAREGLDARALHAHAVHCQRRFVAEIEGLAALPLDALVVPMSEERRGQFLTFALPDAAAIHATLRAGDVVCDVRGDRLRFGFGLYHDDDDIVRGAARIRALLAPT